MNQNISRFSSVLEACNVDVILEVLKTININLLDFASKQVLQGKCIVLFDNEIERLVVLNIFAPSQNSSCNSKVSVLLGYRLFELIIVKDTNVCSSILAENGLVSIILRFVMSEEKYNVIFELYMV
jgi:hypothetical protein